MNRLAVYGFLFLLMSVSCTKTSAPLVYGDYPTEVGRIITQSCAVPGCHTSQSAQAAAGLNLETWQSLFQGSKSGSSVIPYSSKFSPLCYFINTYSDLGLQNQPVMPLNGTALSKEEVKRIMNWIDAGAADQNGKVMWAENPQRKKLYAVNQGCDVVTVIDAETRLPMRYIEVGTKSGIIESPHQVRVSPDGKYWYVVFLNNNVMQKFSCETDQSLGTIPLSPFAAGTSSNTDDDALDWNTFVISNDSKRAYCVSWTLNGKVTAVDLEQRKLLHYLPGFPNAHGICLNAAGDKLYVTAQTGNYITELDTGFSVKKELSLENGIPWTSSPSLDPHDIILSPDGNSLAITCQRSNELRLFNLNTQSVSAIVPTGVYPQEVIYSPSSNRYFVSCPNDTLTVQGAHGIISVIHPASYAVQQVKCGFQPHGIASDENKKLLYVLSRNILSSGVPPHHSSACSGRNGFMNFIDLNSMQVLPEKYELSVDPYFISPRP
ncbi:MAG: YncE family protein [Bacteroidia bacterium]|jgi:DNA-binding beta-propeller fold protein YncE|nr:YncE family protein [Bacteroidia bacterium]